jgi:quercetin dioxygenase-like cupin family protein
MPARGRTPRQDPDGPPVRVLASSVVTGGVCSVVELVLTAETALPPHVHEREDQVLVVMDGVLEITVGDHREEVHVGELAYCPRYVAHQVTVRTPSARVLAVQVPGGLERLQTARLSTRLDPELLLALAGEHGVRLLFPPLTGESTSTIRP